MCFPPPLVPVFPFGASQEQIDFIRHRVREVNKRRGIVPDVSQIVGTPDPAPSPDPPLAPIVLDASHTNS